MLYIFDEVCLVEDDLTERYKAFLSAERQAKIQKLRSPSGRSASAAAYLLLRLALLESYGINEAVKFEYADKGKPFLKDYPNIFFSLSHSKNVAACAVSVSEVGMDVQCVGPITDKVAKRVLTVNEYTAFKDSYTPDEYFCEVWVIKESFLKKTGQGISTELRDIEAGNVSGKTVYKGGNYFCCICGDAGKEILHIRRDDFEKLRN